MFNFSWMSHIDELFPFNLSSDRSSKSHKEWQAMTPKRRPVNRLLNNTTGESVVPGIRTRKQEREERERKWTKFRQWIDQVCIFVSRQVCDEGKLRWWIKEGDKQIRLMKDMCFCFCLVSVAHKGVSGWRGDEWFTVKYKCWEKESRRSHRK